MILRLNLDKLIISLLIFIIFFITYLKQNIYFSLYVEMHIYFTFLDNTGRSNVLENFDIEITTKLNSRLGLVLNCRKVNTV